MNTVICPNCKNHTHEPAVHQVTLNLTSGTNHYAVYHGWCSRCGMTVAKRVYDPDSFDDDFPPPPDEVIAFTDGDRETPDELPRWVG